MSIFKRIDRYHKTRPGHFVFAFFELVLTYIFASIAIDTASMWAYLFAIISFIGALHNIIGFFTVAKTHRAAKSKKRLTSARVKA